MSIQRIIKEIDGNKITDFQGRESVVFEIYPKDHEQMNEDEFMNWMNLLKINLNQLRTAEDKKSSIVQKLYKTNNDETDWYKLYSRANITYLNTTNKETQFSFVELKIPNDPFNFLLGADDFYSDVIIHDDYIHFNSTYIRMINLYELPKSLELFDLQGMSEYFLCFKKIDPDSSRRMINTQRKLHHANIYKNLRNLESEASYLEAEKITEQMMRGEEQIFEAEGWLIVREETLEKLNSKTQELIRLLKQKDIISLIESVSLSSIFKTYLFGVAPLFKRAQITPTSYLCGLLPFKKDQLMNDGYDFQSQSHHEVNFHLFNPSSLNFNALFTGVSGAGKSMGAQKVVNEEIIRGAKVVILDLGNSFDKLARYHEANIFSQKFNPMQFRNPRYLKEFIISVIPEKELSAKIEGKIFKTINESLENIKNFKDLITQLEADIPDISLYFCELWDYFDEEEVNITDLTYVNTSNFPDRIKAPLIIYLIEYFKHLEGKKIFVFDEVWSFLRKNASYIEESFRTFRKENASAIAISQALSDFTSTQLGKVIADLSYYKFLFSQNAEEIAELDSHDKFQIKNVQSQKGHYSEFYLKTEFLKKTIRYYPTPLEYVLFNTEPNEKHELIKFQSIYGEFYSFKNVVDRFVDFKYFNKGIIHE